MQAHLAIRRMLPRRFSTALRTIRNAISVGGQKDQRVLASSRSLLDHQYAAGRWAYLESVQELPRYAVISGYCAHRRSAVSVLDLGCGTGVLRKWLRPELLSDYVGVDLSEVAIHCARREVNGVGKFVAADVALFEPKRRFDVIVFNEVLYYFADPASILRRYASALESHGVFVISLWESPESRRAWRCAADAVTVADAVEVRNERNIAWQIRLCYPSAS